MTEVGGMPNSRPLTVEMINDPSIFQPLTPANILTMKSKVVMLPPGKILGPDLYCRRQWRRVQHIVNEFCLVGGKNTYNYCKSFRNGIPKEEILL